MIALFHKCDAECSKYSNTDHPIKDRWTIDEYKFSRCPKIFVDDSVYYWIRTYNLFKNGILPNDGGWLRQANKFLEVMLFIDLKINENNLKSHGKK